MSSNFFQLESFGIHDFDNFILGIAKGVFSFLGCFSEELMIEIIDKIFKYNLIISDTYIKYGVIIPLIRKQVTGEVKVGGGCKVGKDPNFF